MTRLEAQHAARGETPETMLARLAASVNRSPLASLLGISPTKCWNGEAELIIPIRPEVTQHHGTVYGGVIGIRRRQRLLLGRRQRHRRSRHRQLQPAVSTDARRSRPRMARVAEPRWARQRHRVVPEALAQPARPHACLGRVL
jgi:hypothetical protein